MQRLICDDLTIHALIDARPAPVPVTWSFPDVDEAAWATVNCAGLDGEGRFAPSLGCFLVRLGGASILCDAGIGPGPNAYLGGLSGSLPELLAELELDPSAIDAVVFTHLHMDHVGWAASPAGPHFPNATYYAPAEDFAYFANGGIGSGSHHMAAFENCVRPLADAGRLVLLEDDATIRPGVRYVATPGHTPGHQSLLFRSSGGEICVTGDVFHCPAQVERTEWSHRADFDPAEARRSRHEFIEQAVAGDWLLAAGHFSDGLQFGRIARDGESFAWRPENGTSNNKNNHRSHTADFVSTTGG